jgi:hypothetical protein
MVGARPHPLIGPAVPASLLPVGQGVTAGRRPLLGGYAGLYHRLPYMSQLRLYRLEAGRFAVRLKPDQ